VRPCGSVLIMAGMGKGLFGSPPESSTAVRASGCKLSFKIPADSAAAVDDEHTGGLRAQLQHACAGLRAKDDEVDRLTAGLRAKDDEVARLTATVTEVRVVRVGNR
jgi:hypothetical protein